MQSSEGADRVTETLVIRYWAGARAAAGVDDERVPAVATVDELTSALVGAHPGLATVLPVCSVLVGGRASSGTDPVPPGSVIEVLPPFAGG